MSFPKKHAADCATSHSAVCTFAIKSPLAVRLSPSSFWQMYTIFFTSTATLQPLAFQNAPKTDVAIIHYAF